MSDFSPLTSTTRPETSAIITIRLIKSFEYRTSRNIVLKDLNLTVTTPKKLLEIVKKYVIENNSFKPYKNIVDTFDTIKLYAKAHGHKTQNLIINMEDDDNLILKDLDKPLSEYNIENESELSIFNKKLYEEYKANPVNKWI